MLGSRDRRVPRLSAFVCVAALGLGGCQGRGKDGGANAEAGEEGLADGGSARAKDDRIPALSGAAVGLHPGYLEGGMMFASWRAGAMQQVLQSLPMSPREAKDVAEIGMVLGADPRVDDVLAHLGVDPNARISMSVRPVVTWVDELEAALASDSPATRELTGRGGDDYADSRPAAEVLPFEDTGLDGQIEPIPVPPPPPLSPAAVALNRKAKSLGVHVRVHLPIATPGKIDHMISLLSSQVRDAKWAATCAALGPVRACGGQSDSVVVLRDVPGGLQLDWLFTFTGDYDHPDDEFRRAAIQEALAAPATTAAPALAALRGDAVLLVDGPGAVATMRAAAVSNAMWNLGSGHDQSDWVEHSRARAKVIQRLHETERMFEGVSVELQLDGDSAVATGRWLPTALGRKRMAEVFELTQIDADVPSVAALCDGALVCGRSRGLPDRKRFASLATGIYADPNQLGRELDDHEDEAATVLFLETWPNAIGTVARLPGNTFQPPESFIVQNVMDVASRVLGAGFSIRSLNETRHTVTGDWVGYARMTAADLAAVRGFLQMADSRLSPVSIPEVPGRVEFTPIPDNDVSGNFYAIHDPAAATGEWGWAVLADSDDRVRWLAGRGHDDGSVPLVYLEVGDLWRLVASFEEGRRDLGFAQSWLSRRWVRGQVSLGEGGAPELRVAIGKLD
ncbi:hypothetical protein DB30_03742 [Enhygromyxa salina]|uniref:Uncharacterized protein n=1 Tax=Enhygromyxa salina TaxID=215803 RepID=A0A0C2D662_9BACT|nr:hypothetical protein [Enhygromyxa salina]KIG17145.1 hypothetical protein DB30_03742 [Enhygromyxa salina]